MVLEKGSGNMLKQRSLRISLNALTLLYGTGLQLSVKGSFLQIFSIQICDFNAKITKVEKIILI